MREFAASESRSGIQAPVVTRIRVPRHADGARARPGRGVAGPRGISPATITLLESAIRKTVEAVEFTRASERFGVRPAFLPAPEFGALIAKEDAELAQLMQAIGLKK